jgi:hypothetical protein
MMATWNTHTETKQIEKDPRTMQSVEEHQDVPKGRSRKYDSQRTEEAV